VHLPLKLALDRPRVAGEEVDDAVDDLVVGLLLNGTDPVRRAERKRLNFAHELGHLVMDIEHRLDY
jgi:Zn-dependent peptidase ImmA (M78 family)